MKVVFCWMGVSGYMAACWREMSRRIDRLHVISFVDQANRGNSEFGASILTGVSHEYVTCTQASDASKLSQLIMHHSPDVLVVCGWAVKVFRHLSEREELRHVKFVMGMDNPWLGTLRQRLARYVLRAYIKRMSLVVVAGERCWQFARRLGVPESQIRRGVYGVDVRMLEEVHLGREKRCHSPSDWPKRFLYVGRLVSVKGIQTLLDGYTKYRNSVSEPWPLDVCGLGLLAENLHQVEGVHHHGFVQPSDMVKVWSDAGVFVLASTYDPWPLVVVEACAAGLPVVCSEACGSSVEMIRQYYNGISVATADAKSLCDALLWMHRNHNSLKQMGARSHNLALSYSADAWADRWCSWFKEILHTGYR